MDECKPLAAGHVPAILHDQSHGFWEEVEAGIYSLDAGEGEGTGVGVGDGLG